jgi:hypothetical protein
VTTPADLEQHDNPHADHTTGADETLAAMRDLMSQQGIAPPDGGDGGDDGQPAAELGDQVGDDVADLSPAQLEQRDVTPAKKEAPAAPAAPAPKVEAPPKDQAEYMARLSARDRKIVELSQRNRELEAFDAAMRSGKIVEALHQRYGLTASEYNRRALDLPELPGGKPKPDATIDLSGLPPELQKALSPVLQKVSSLEQQNAQLLERARTTDQEREQQQQTAQRQQQVGMVKGYLEPKAEAYPLLDAFGAHEKVFDKVLEHVRLHGQFETDQDAAYVLDQIASEVEADEQKRLSALLEKPHAKKFLQERLTASSAAKKEAMPARPDPRATPRGRSNGAAPAVPNSLATQRASRGKQPGWAGLTLDQQLERTAAEAITREAG